jgi:hypothetical protein
MASKSRIATGTNSRRHIDVRITVEGVDKTSEEFRQARREFNKAIRGVMVRVGEREVLPEIKREMGAYADFARPYVQRERSGVFIGSKARGAENRAVGWLDFGGKRPLDTARREGPYAIVRSLDRKRDRIDDEVTRELLKTFHPLDTSKQGF